MRRWLVVLLLGCAATSRAAVVDPTAQCLDALLSEPLTPETAVQVAVLNAELARYPLPKLVRDVKIAFIEVQAAQAQWELQQRMAGIDVVVAREVFERRTGLWGRGRRWEISAPLPDAPAEALAVPVLAARITSLSDEPHRAEVEARYDALVAAHVKARSLRSATRTPAYVDALRRYWTALACLQFSLDTSPLG